MKLLATLARVYVIPMVTNDRTKHTTNITAIKSAPATTKSIIPNLTFLLLPDQQESKELAKFRTTAFDDVYLFIIDRKNDR